MTRTDRTKLYELLAQFYPNAKQLKSDVTLTAYGLALEPYRYEDVRKRVLEHVRRSKYFPDVADLTAGLAVYEPDEPDEPADRAPEPWMLDRADKLAERVEALGGVCPLLHAHRGTVGEIVRAHVPHDCPDGCRKYAAGHCIYR